MRDETDLIVHDTDDGQSRSTGGLERTPDKGPWEAQARDDGSVVLQSDDFEHDVALVVTGDFDGDKMDYAQRLAAWMNAYLRSNDKLRGAL